MVYHNARDQGSAHDGQGKTGPKGRAGKQSYPFGLLFLSLVQRNVSKAPYDSNS